MSLRVLRPETAAVKRRLQAGALNEPTTTRTCGHTYGVVHRQHALNRPTGPDVGRRTGVAQRALRMHTLASPFRVPGTSSAGWCNGSAEDVPVETDRSTRKPLVPDSVILGSCGSLSPGASGFSHDLPLAVPLAVCRSRMSVSALAPFLLCPIPYACRQPETPDSGLTDASRRSNMCATVCRYVLHGNIELRDLRCAASHHGTSGMLVHT